MELSDSEKLILIMLSEIYEHLEIDGDIDPKFIQSAIHSGNNWGIKRKYTGIFSDSDGNNSSIVPEVQDILDMWYILEYSYEKLSLEDKRKIKTEAAPFGRAVKFTGFDGNNEADYLNVAYFLVNDLELFSYLKDRDLNAHFYSLDAYRRMLAAYKPIRSSPTFGDSLSATEIIQVLKEQTHPDHRK